MIKAILFDFDGVLTLDKYGSDSILKYLSEHTAIPMDRLRSAYYKFNKGLLYGQYTHTEIWNDFCESVGSDIDFQILVNSFINTPLDADMLSLVRNLKKQYLIGMITDNKVDRIDAILYHHHLTDLFDVVTVSAACKSGKTDRKIFDITLSLLNVDANESVFIDNSAKNLIVPTEMGIHTILFDDETRDVDMFTTALYDVLLNDKENAIERGDTLCESE